MWIIDRVKDKDNRGYNKARCHKCGYAFNIDLFTQKDVAMIMEAHLCNNPEDSFYNLF
jgi:hypothetical protein